MRRAALAKQGCVRHLRGVPRAARGGCCARYFAPGCCVFHQGDESHSMFFLTRGVARVTKRLAQETWILREVRRSADSRPLPSADHASKAWAVGGLMG